MNCVVVGGFLGSGKTTYVNYLLNHFGELYPKKKMALLINEFGEIPVDAALMDAGNYSMREIIGGCICCTLKGMLADAVTELKKKESPDLLVIEATGLAVPSEIAVSVGPAGGCSVFTQLCVDVEQYTKLAGRLAIYDRQLADADMVLLTKKDIRSREVLKTVENELIESNETRSCFSSNVIAAEAAFTNTVKITTAHHYAHHDKHSLKEDITQVTHRLAGENDLNVLESRLCSVADKAGPDLYRIKGIVRTKSGWKVIQFTDGKMSVKTVNPPNSGESFIVFIGKYETVEEIKL